MAEYAAGRTPNPCLRCNEKIKFAAVLDRAIALGFDAVATGHYAQLATGDDGLIEMHRAVDTGKDQSYVLGVLTQEQLAHSLFPLGDSRKSDVRERGRRGAACRSPQKPDSHDICFISDGDTAGWLHEKLGAGAPATIVDHATGEVLGRHEGSYGFTIGQRKGLRIGRPAADGKPRFVLDIEPVSGTVTVGPREELDRRPHRGHPAALVRRRPDRAAARHRPAARARRRAPRRGHGRPATTVRVELLDPAQGIAPGQAAVVYDGTAGRRLVHDRRDRRAPASPRDRAPPASGRCPASDAADVRPRRPGRARASCPTCRTCPSCPGRGAHADMTGRTLARGRRARRRPAARRLAADRRARASTTAARSRCWPRTSTRSRSSPRATPARSRSRSPVRGRWRPPSSGRAATGCSPTTAPAASWRRRSPRGCAATSPTSAAGSPTPSSLVQVDEPALPAVLAGPGPDRLRLPPAPLGRPAPGAVRGPGVGVRRGHRGRCHPGRALLRVRRTRRAADRRGRRRGLGRPRRAPGRGVRRPGRRCSSRGGRCYLGVVPVAPPRARRRRTRAVTERVLRLARHARPRPGGEPRRWWSPRPAGWPGRTRTWARRAPRPVPEVAANAASLSRGQTPTPSGTSSVARSSCLALRKTSAISGAEPDHPGAGEERVGRALGEGDLPDQVCSAAPAAAGRRDRACAAAAGRPRRARPPCPG